MTPFCFEHVFDVPSAEALFAAYFDPEHQAEQDRAVDIVEREVLEQTEADGQLRRVSRVVPRRQIPAVLRPFTSGPLHYIETVTWRRGAPELEVDIRPSLMNGRARIRARYRVEPVGPNAVRREYAGEVSVDVSLLAGRVEKGIVAELSRSVPIAARSTQAWLTRQTSRSVAART